MKKEFAIEIGIFAICITLTSLFWRFPFLLAACFILISIYMLYLWHTKSDFIFYFVAFVLGPVAETIAIYFGAWKYSKPFYLIPIWLPFLWGITALFMKKLSETLLIWK